MAKKNSRYGSFDRNSATARASRNGKKRRKKTGRVTMLVLVLMASIFYAVIGHNISKSSNELKELEKKEAKLIEKRDEQLDLKEELEERAVYVKTKAYVEEMAKKLGLVYPDEVVIKPEEEKW